MKVTGNMVKAKIAQYHNIKPEEVIMNALRWEILAENHAAIVWYATQPEFKEEIKSKGLAEIKYACIAVDGEVYINEQNLVTSKTDITSSDGWLQLSTMTTHSGAQILDIIKSL